MKIFILEDEIHKYPRNQLKEVLEHHTLTLAVSVEDAKAKFKGVYDLLLLDHDMEGFYEKSDAPNTGHQFVKWMLEAFPEFDAPVILHSQNPVGRYNMRNLLMGMGFDVQEFPFGPAYVKALKESYGYRPHSSGR